MTNSHAKTNKPTQKDSLRSIIAGINKRLTGVSQLTLGGATYTPAALVQLITALIGLIDVASANENTWHDAVKAVRGAAAQLRPILRALKSWVILQYGDSSAALGDFGYTPTVARQPSVATKAGALQKTRATRAARHTAGKRQKQAIKGEVAPVPAAPPPHA
jgi:hypothetical protein